MFKITRNDRDTAYGIKEFACDTVDDLKDLPKCTMGSIAVVIEDASVYMINGNGEWVEL